MFLTVNSGQCTISAASVGKSLTCTGYTNTLTHNAFTLTISGSVTLVSGMTYTPLETSTISIPATGTFTTGGKLIPLLTLTGGTTTLGDNLSFMASKLIVLSMSGGAIDLNGKTISGNSATNRIRVRSNVLGTARTMVVNSGTFANADFRDISLSPATDLSAITGNSGDSGGNSNITFTTAATQTWQGTSSGNWSDSAKWTSRVPLPQDDVVISSAFSASQTVTVDMPALGKSIDWTGSTGSPTWNISSIATEILGSLTLISGMTLTVSNTVGPTFSGRGAFTITSAGKTFGMISFKMFGGTITLQDAFISSSQDSEILNGTLDANDFNVTLARFDIDVTATKVLIMGSGTWTLTSTGTVWEVTATGTTITPETSTIVIANNSASAKAFSGGAMTYNNLTISSGGAGIVSILTAITFNTFTINAPKTVQFIAATTYTFTNFIAVGSSGNVITIASTTGSPHQLSKASGTVSSNWLDLTNSQASGGAVWYAGANSTDNGGNTGWIFTDAPFVSSSGGFLGFLGRISPLGLFRLAPEITTFPRHLIYPLYTRANKNKKKAINTSKF